MVIIVMASTFALAAAFVPGGLAAMRDPKTAAAMTPSPRYMALNLAFSFVAAYFGGVVTMRIAARSPNGHLIALACVVLAMGVVSLFMRGAERQPGWYKLVVPLVGVAGIAASTVLRGTPS